MVNQNASAAPERVVPAVVASDDDEPIPRQGRLRRPHLSAEDRRAAMDAVMINPSPPVLRRYAMF